MADSTHDSEFTVTDHAVAQDKERTSISTTSSSTSEVHPGLDSDIPIPSQQQNSITSQGSIRSITIAENSTDEESVCSLGVSADISCFDSVVGSIAGQSKVMASGNGQLHSEIGHTEHPPQREVQSQNESQPIVHQLAHTHELSKDPQPSEQPGAVETTEVKDPALGKQQAINTALLAQIEQLTAEINDVRSSLKDPDAGATIARHIKLLHSYNEIRDIGLGLMGMVADRRGLRIGVVMKEFGVAEGD